MSFKSCAVFKQGPYTKKMQRICGDLVINFYDFLPLDSTFKLLFGIGKYEPTLFAGRGKSEADSGLHYTVEGPFWAVQTRASSGLYHRVSGLS